ncbi:MAG TPA: hypothetical protein VFT56_13990 [Sphingomonas sp.]|nr:hypothetical protein [Sphingomonas sp.]
MDVFAPDLGVGAAELSLEQLAEFRDDLRGHSAISCVELALEDGDIGLGAGSLRANVGELGGDLGIVRTACLVSNQLDHPRTLAVKLGQSTAQPLELTFALGHRRRGAIQPCLQECAESLRPGQMPSDGIDHQIVELFHRHAAA